MGGFIDEVGHRYGRLIVLEYAGTHKNVAYFTVQFNPFANLRDLLEAK
jgi:hypothetical protein